MWTQSSYQHKEMAKPGCLYIVPTPIGNLQDMSPRAVETLKQVDYIAAEDTRHTRKLLHVFQIEKRLVSYHEHNQQKSGQAILQDLEQGAQIALVSDAGMPAISDPGEDLVKLAVQARIPVIALPGPTASLTALVASGLAAQPFTFYGFLARDKKQKAAELTELRYHRYTLIFYEAPHRLQQTLEIMTEYFGDREAVLVRELSKVHEEYIRGLLPELKQWSKEQEIRGEFVIIVAGCPKEEQPDEQGVVWWQELSLKEHVEEYINQNLSTKEAIKQTAKDRQINKRDVYQAYHVDEE